MPGDPRSARLKALADIQMAQEQARIDEITARLQGQAKASAAALKGRAGVMDADRAAAEAAAAEQGGEETPDITQFFPASPVNATNPLAGIPNTGSIAPTTALEGAGPGAARGGALANSAVAGARQAAGTAPSGAPPQQSGRGGAPGMSVNVGGQQFSAPDEVTTTRTTTGPQQFDPGFFFNATTTETVTQPNVLSAADILAAQQRNQAMTNETLFRLGQENVVGPDAVTAATALNVGDYKTFGEVMARNPLLSVQVQKKNLDVLDEKMRGIRAATAEAFERTRGQKIINDALVKQFGATASGMDPTLDDNMIFGIAAPGAQSLGFPTSVSGALRASGGGDLTPNQVLDTVRSIKVDKEGALDAGSASALLAMQGWGIKHGIAVYAAPKRGTFSDLKRSFGIGSDEVSHVQMVPMNEILTLALNAEAGDAEATKRLVETGLFRSDGQGGLDVIDSGPNAAMSAGLRRKLQFLADAYGYGASPSMPQVDIPATDMVPAEPETPAQPSPFSKRAMGPGEFLGQMAEAGKRVGQRTVLGKEQSRRLAEQRTRPPSRPTPIASPKPYGP